MTKHPIALVLCLPLLAAACGPREDVGQPIVVEPPADEPPADQPTADTPAPTSGGGDDLVVGDDPCTTDGDCVPAECCHASACVARENAPDCGDAICTQDCQYGTLDCGGACVCHEGRCAARLSEPPAGLPTAPPGQP